MINYKYCLSSLSKILPKGLYKPNMIAWNGYLGGNDTQHLNFWTSWIQTFIDTMDYSLVIEVSNVMDDCLYRGPNSDHSYSSPLFAVGATEFTYEKIKQNIWHNSWCNLYWLDLNMEDVKGVVCRPTAGAGGGVQCLWQATAIIGGVSRSYNAVYGIDNDSNKPSYGTSNGSVVMDGVTYKFYTGS